MSAVILTENFIKNTRKKFPELLSKSKKLSVSDLAMIMKYKRELSSFIRDERINLTYKELESLKDEYDSLDKFLKQFKFNG